MSALGEHLSLTGQFIRQDLRRPLIGCLIGLAGSILAGAVAGSASPETVESALASFTQMVEQAGVVTGEGALSPFALLFNNWWAMIMAMAYGFLPFLFLPALSLLSNGFLIGIMWAWYASQNISPALFLAALLPHGIFELSALLLAIACGMRLCRNMSLLVTSSPRRTPMVELLCDLLRVLLLVIAPLTVAAAFLECYVTPRIAALFL